MVADGRSAKAYAREHIPGAANLPHSEISAESTASLDRSRHYVCYCDGYATEGVDAQVGAEITCAC